MLFIWLSLDLTSGKAELTLCPNVQLSGPEGITRKDLRSQRR